MREILAPAAEALGGGSPIALATVWSATGSSPREPGATMLVLPDGRAFGNVSAGCVDGAVHALCTAALEGAGPVVERFGIADDDAIAVGLACGGTIEVLVRRVDVGTADAAALGLLARSDAANIPLTAWLHRDGRLEVAPADDCGPEALRDALPESLAIEVGAAPRLIIVGAVEVAVSLTALASVLGFRVTVVDPRDVFANPTRFPGAEVVVDQPGRYLAATALDARSAVCVLTHDAKFDVPALRAALASTAGYVGAMGSRRTHTDRVRRLGEAGVPAASVARLRSPIGLDLRGRAPREIALSILAEIVALARGGSGVPLTELSGPVYAPTGAPVPETRTSPRTRMKRRESVRVSADLRVSGDGAARAAGADDGTPAGAGCAP